MSRKVGIIGMGHVGSTVAHGLIAQGAFDDYVLIDINEKKVTADAVDTGAADTTSTRISKIIRNECFFILITSVQQSIGRIRRSNRPDHPSMILYDGLKTDRWIIHKDNLTGWGKNIYKTMEKIFLSFRIAWQSA